MSRAIKILLATALAAAAWWFWRRNKSEDTTTRATGASGSKAITLPGDGKGNYSIGQIGSTLVQQDTKGDALATAIGDLLGSGGAGSFRYAGPDFVIESQKLDVGSYTALRAVATVGQRAAALRAQEKIVMMPPQYRHESIGSSPLALAYQTVGGQKIGFNPNDPTTFVILPGGII